jgi:hypothetical protein
MCILPKSDIMIKVWMGFPSFFSQFFFIDVADVRIVPEELLLWRFYIGSFVG